MGLNETDRKPTGAHEEVPAGEVRDRLTDIMNRIVYRNERFIITRQGEPVAAIVGLDDLRRLDDA